MKLASYFNKLEDNKVQCFLCPHNCKIAKDKRGVCKVRKNIEGELYSEVYNMVSAIHSDPIEKKPLYHFHPKSQILSIGSIGCNLSCSFCQNCDISQVTIDDFPFVNTMTDKDIINKALHTDNNIGIAYTYNEPVIWHEFMLDTAIKAKAHNLFNIAVSNGFVNQKPLLDLLPYFDAFNIDLKAFSDDFYKKYTGGSLKPVLNTLKTINQHGKHLEITNLIIPTLNDEKFLFEDMVKWIAFELGKETVFHISRYFPRHQITIPPTPKNTMYELKKIANKYLDNVYLGNIG
jgi:pyruvate formate lyase activating enzyme